jgi:uncharacterized protein YjiS (DUF1127 family)
VTPPGDDCFYRKTDRSEPQKTGHPAIYMRREMASFNDRIGLSEAARGSTDGSAARFAAPTPSLISRLTGKLQTWRQRDRERAQLAQLSHAELRDIGISLTDRWAEIHKPFWRR